MRELYITTLPIEGDLKGYLSGKSTRTFHTPPSYGADEKTVIKQREEDQNNEITWPDPKSSTNDDSIATKR